ncbi:MAG: DNA methyltransferase [Oligoflexia bacterium]|nr:DNA methyltransferase [Oligoflexia bacterium]
MDTKTKSRNKTLILNDNERSFSEERVISIREKVRSEDIENKILHQDVFDTLDLLPNGFIDLVFADPPYNMDKKFNDVTFKKMDIQSYGEYTEKWISKLKNKLTNDASVYVCGDWRSSSALYTVLSKYFKVRNRITFEREKGRGAKTNYKNCSEDIFFCTNSDTYTFNVETIKLRKKVIAPYRENGEPKDWKFGFGGVGYRDTFPSNIWTDITIPFWSMKENTEHPTQKPEKLLAKILLASSNENDIVFDPFLGSGTTSVVAEKLNRKHVGIEIDEQYCLIAQKRLRQAKKDKRIQGYTDGVFWERNAPNSVA